MRLDVRHTLRRLRASPGFALVAILSLGLAIGANVIVTAVARALLFDPLPINRPAELAFFDWSRTIDDRVSNIGSNNFRDPSDGLSYTSNVSAPAYRLIRDTTPAGAQVAAFALLPEIGVGVEGQPSTIVAGVLASGTYFRVVQPQLTLGRALDDRDDRPDAEPAAVISHALWLRAFAGAPDVLGSTLLVNGRAVRIVGVTAAGFRGLAATPTEITLPLSAQPWVARAWTPESGSLATSDLSHWLRVVARVPNAVSRPAWTSALTAALGQYVVEAHVAESVSAAAVHARLVSGARGVDTAYAGFARTRTETSISILAIATGVVLLLACVNLAGLMLARGLASERELAVRAALGASRWRLVRLTLIESAALATAGTLTGLAVALAGRRVLMSTLTSGLGTTVADYPIDMRELAVTAAIAVATMILVAVVPAWRLSIRRDEAIAMSGAGQRVAPKLRTARALLTLQIAISLPLVAGAALLIGTVRNLHDVNLGFRPDGLVVFSLRATAPIDPRNSAAAFERVRSALEQMPGATAATLVENALVSGISSNTTAIVDGAKTRMWMNATGPRFFETMGIPIVAGRLPRENASEVVVNETAARNVFHGAALGRRFSTSYFDVVSRTVRQKDVVITGVVADTRYANLRDPIRPTFFDDVSQRPSPRGVTVVVRASRPAAAIEQPIRALVSSLASSFSVVDYASQLTQIDHTIGRERVFARVLTGFGVAALLLAGIGLYGVMSYATIRRTREIGVRLALGATPAHVRGLVLRQVIVLGAIGVAIGAPLAIAAAPLLNSLLYGLTARDPHMLIAAACVMLLATLIAGWLPARRAAALDPIEAIRRE
jgi:predicted permease